MLVTPRAFNISLFEAVNDLVGVCNLNTTTENHLNHFHTTFKVKYWWRQEMCRVTDLCALALTFYMSFLSQLTLYLFSLYTDKNGGFNNVATLQ